MKTKIAVLFIALILIISACKKSSVFSGSKIARINNYSAGYSETFTYNSSDGSIATMVKNGVKFEYYYSGDTVTVAQINGLGQTVNAIVYIKNSSGYCDSSQGEFTLRNNSNAYAYDGNGQLTQLKTFVSHALTSTDNYTNNSAKNLVETQHINAATNATTYDYYTYYLSNNNTIGVQNMGQYYLGVSSVNLVQTDIQINAALDTSDIITYHYRYDGSGNVDTLVSYHRDGTRADSISFNYY